MITQGDAPDAGDFGPGRARWRGRRGLVAAQPGENARQPVRIVLAGGRNGGEEDRKRMRAAIPQRRAFMLRSGLALRCSIGLW